MSTHYRQLPLDEVEVGAVLSDDVRDEQGVVLLSTGTSLTASLLKSLARHGVASVQIQTTAQMAEADMSQEASQENKQADPQRQQQLERLKSLFRLETCDEASGLLCVYLQQYRSGARS
jgi:hypothetical protein